MRYTKCHAHFVGEMGQQFEDAGADGDIQHRDRLICHQEFRFDRDGPRDGNALQLAA